MWQQRPLLSDTGTWRRPRVGHGDMEEATCGTHQRATHTAGGNAMSGTLRTLKQDCFPQGIGRHFQSEAPKGLEIHVVINILNILK